MNTKVKNANAKKAVTKKTAKQLVKKTAKPLTKAQKEERRKKRLANPQISHLASAVYKAEILEFKFDAKANLVEAKRRQNKVNFVNSGYENLADLKLANKVINAICKKPEFIEISIEAVRTNKDGSFSPYYFNQMMQKLVKLLGKNFTIQTALVHLANVRKAK
jgi:hypothetical protein